MNKKYFGVHREGWKFFLIFSLLSFLSLTISKVLFLLFIIFSFFTLWFFRDPERASENIDDQLLSAADGKICFIGEEIPPRETNIRNKMKKVSIFMNIFNVHINRSPVNGDIEKIIYKNGKFFNASLDKASNYNEEIHSLSMPMVIKLSWSNYRTIARRILGFISEGHKISKGDRIGLIRLAQG